ncbi:SymE family type I addiction module toxin, partial [Escherichia coli]|uniref:SymE family type I addiction module toxin n=1 Tax=Escherichia coli TaxID=562 RepID=UPI00128F4AEB
MTDTHSISESFEPEVYPANNRHVTVGYASRYPDCSRIPAITLKGQWLEAAGFATGTVVDVKVMEGCIVL